MATYRVPMLNTVYAWVTVEADSPEEAIEEAEKEGLPGLMMLDHRYPEDADGWIADPHGSPEEIPDPEEVDE